MTGTKITGRYLAQKIAIPVFLVIALLAAKLLVDIKSAVILSTPVELNRSGLSVSMPLGNGWQCDKKWIYVKDGFLVRSVLSIDATTQSYAQCRYLLAYESVDSKERFDREAADLGGKVVQSGQMQINKSAAKKENRLIIDWAKIIRYADQEDSQNSAKPSVLAYEVLFGICQMPGGRLLEIEVLSQEYEQGPAWNAFERISKNIGFNDDGLLQAGIELVGEVKNAGISNILAESPQVNPFDSTQGRPEGSNPLVSLFILINSRGRKVGFTLNTIVAQTPSVDGQATAQPEIKAADYFYSPGPIPDEEVALYRGNDNFEQFTWTVEKTSKTGSEGIKMECSSGLLTLNLEGPQQSPQSLRPSPAKKETVYVIGKAAVPDIINEPVLRKILDSNHQELIFDLIRSDGTIAPMYIKKIPAAGEKSSTGTVLKLELLDGRGYWYQIYYDQAGKQTKIVLGQENVYTLISATANEVAEAFPERANIVYDQRRLLERDGI
jgi:hypothetical protein